MRFASLTTYHLSDETVKLNNAIDDLSSEMHWMKHALIEWMQAMEQGNQTIALIDKYCKNDLKRADALDMRRRKLQTDILRNATLLRELCDEQTTLEQTLDRTAHLYRQRHLDRRQMVDTWRDMVAAMNGRDNAIREAEEVCAILRPPLKIILVIIIVSVSQS